MSRAQRLAPRTENQNRVRPNLHDRISTPDRPHIHIHGSRRGYWQQAFLSAWGQTSARNLSPTFEHRTGLLQTRCARVHVCHSPQRRRRVDGTMVPAPGSRKLQYCIYHPPLLPFVSRLPPSPFNAPSFLPSLPFVSMRGTRAGISLPNTTQHSRYR